MPALFQYPPFLFLGLFAILSHLSFGTNAGGTPKAVNPKGLRKFKEIPSKRRKQQQASNKLGSSSRQQEHSLTLPTRGDGAILTSVSTVVMRQGQEAELQCGDNQSLFRIEVTTDNWPQEMSWELVDVRSNTTVMAYDNFDRKYK